LHSLRHAAEITLDEKIPSIICARTEGVVAARHDSWPKRIA